MNTKTTDPNTLRFTGNIFVFQAYDVGDDINLEKIKASGAVIAHPLTLSKHFKNYHMPLAITLPEDQANPPYMSAKIHNFGVVSLIYQIPFADTLENVRKDLDAIDNSYEEQSRIDIERIYKKISRFIGKSFFYHTRSSYVLIQVDPQPQQIDTVQLKDSYGGIIASALRFETESLSEHQKDEILASAFGYFRGDLMVIDTEASFAYDDEYREILDFFEFANIQHLELRYFDRVLDQQLYSIYEERARKVPLKAYLPFIGTMTRGPVDELGKLKVDISVITERLEGSVKLAGEPYYSELYALLVEKRELKNLLEAIHKKLSIIHDVRSVLQKKIDTVREDLLTVLIILLIIIELIIGMLK